jgi:histidyl-tRNA synthetase
MQIKTLKGTIDCAGDNIILREAVFTQIRRILVIHNAKETDTSAFELKHSLTNRYGKDSELIYYIANQGGDLCALRNDLTVPFARW